MADLNYCSFIGRLGKDPETRYLPNGDAVCSFSIAVGERWKDKESGEQRETTEWVRCIAWRRLGEVCGEYLKKGAQVFVSGKFKTRKWQDKEGNDRYTSEIVLGQMQMLGSKKNDGDEPATEPRDGIIPGRKPPEERQEPEQRKAPAGKFDDMDDDIPF